MARPLDEAKRQELLHAAKRLFASQGFHATAMADLAQAAGLPVGTIYTYFENKEALLVAIVGDGWAELSGRMSRELQAAPDLEGRIARLARFFFEDLLSDLDFINLLLTEAPELTGLNRKLDQLMDLVEALRKEAKPAQAASPVGPRERAAVVVYFMGLLHAARLSPAGQLGYGIADIKAYLLHTIHQNLAAV